MRIFSRRALLKMGVGLVAFVPAIRALASSPSSSEKAAPPIEQRVIEQYVTGPVTAIGQDWLRIKSAWSGDVVLHISQETELWKGDTSRRIPVEIGDWVKAWGPRRADGSHDVEKMWVNIINLQGIASQVEKGEKTAKFHHKDGRLGTHVVTADEQTFVVPHGEKETTYNRAIDIRDGQFVQVIGLELKDKTVRATRIFLD